MDRIDREILAALQADGRITFTELAAELNLSVSSCQRRVRDLEAQGIIRGYRAVVDGPASGFGFDVLLFATLARPDAIHEFDTAIADVPEIIEAHRLFGEPDYMIRVVTTDRDAYQRLVDEVLTKLPGLRGLNSTFTMKESVPLRGFPFTSRSTNLG